MSTSLRKRLAVCILARNEEDHLAEAIASVREVADQVFVTDTGSTDRTVAIAEEQGAHVDYWPWRDDFGAARNHQLDLAKDHDWLLILDADERLHNHQKDLLNEALNRKDCAGLSLLRRDLQDLDNLDSGTEMRVLRLIRPSSGLRFIGRCHVQQTSKEHLIEHCEVKLLHYGYLEEYLPAKTRRSLRLLRLELEERPGQLYYQIELYRTLALLGNTEAKEALRAAAANLASVQNHPRAPLEHAALLLEGLLQLPSNQLPAPFTPTKVENLCKRWFPEAPPLLWLRARNAFVREDWEEAEKLLSTLVSCGESDNYDRYTSFDAAILGKEAALNLAACKIKLGYLEGASDLLEPLQNDPKVGPAAAANLALVAELSQQLSELS